MDAWEQFLIHASRSGMPDISVWRYGVTNPAVSDLLKERTAAGGTC